jgi:uncharacterized protein YqeY
MSNEQLIAITAIIGFILTFITARASASSGAVSALSDAIATLRTELKEAEKRRKDTETEYKAALAEEIKKRQELAAEFEKERAELKAMFERERDRYQKYIAALLEYLTSKGLNDYPEWNPEE